jgi:hypothetical protein
MVTRLGVLGGAVGALLASTAAHATLVDLTTAGASGTLNGGVFTQGDVGSGTGVFPAFEQANPGGSATTEQAYNTTVNNVLDNGSDDTHNHEILLSAVPVINVGGTNYYSFRLDINEDELPPRFDPLDRVITPARRRTRIHHRSHGHAHYDSGANAVLLDDSWRHALRMELRVPIADTGSQTDLFICSPLMVDRALHSTLPELFCRMGSSGRTGRGTPGSQPPPSVQACFARRCSAPRFSALDSSGSPGGGNTTKTILS